MANGYFERGEVYWVRMDNGFGGEQGVGRPGVILTGNDVNQKCSTVTIAFLSKQYHASNPFYLPVEATGITSYVILNQIMTYDKARIGKYLGTLTRDEQKSVDDALEDIFDLGYVDDSLVKEKESEIADLNLLINETKAEVAGVRAEAEKKDEEIASLKMEIEMWQKCYSRCMDMLVDTKVNGDLSRRTVAPKNVVIPETPKKVVDSDEPAIELPPVEQPVETPKDERLDINSCTATALKKIGFSLAMARKIVESRPFDSVEDLKRINGLKATQFRVMAPKLCCNPATVEETEVIAAPAKKVNINTASLKEMAECFGTSRYYPSKISIHRKKNGLFSSLEELKQVESLPKDFYERFGHLCTIGEEV